MGVRHPAFFRCGALVISTRAIRSALCSREWVQTTLNHTRFKELSVRLAQRAEHQQGFKANTKYELASCFYIDLAATFLFDFTGAMAALKRGYDWIGLLVLAIANEILANRPLQSGFRPG